MLSPFITPPEIGEQWLTRFLPAHETNPNAGQLAASFAGGGYVEEIGGKTYVVFRSVSDRPVSGLAAYLSPEDYRIERLKEDDPNYSVDEYMNEYIIIEPEAIEKLFYEKFSRIFQWEE